MFILDLCALFMLLPSTGFRDNALRAVLSEFQIIAQVDCKDCFSVGKELSDIAGLNKLPGNNRKVAIIIMMMLTLADLAQLWQCRCSRL